MNLYHRLIKFSKGDKIIIFFFISLILFYLFQLNRMHLANVETAIAWWLFNYEGGIVRRGFTGTLLISLSHSLNFSLLKLLIIYQSLLFITFISLFYFYIRKKNYKIFWLLLIIFSPVTFLVYVYDIFYIARQELLLFIVFLIYLNFIINNKLNYKIAFILSIFASLSLLSHELFLFYISYFLTLHLLIYKKKDSFFYKKFILFIFLPILSAITIFFYGVEFDGEIMCNKIIKAGIDKSYCSSLSSHSHTSILHSIKFTLQHAIGQNYLYVYAPVLIISLLSFLFLVHSLKNKNFGIKKFLFVFIFNFIYSFPIFILVHDWGRYLYIHFTLLLIICIYYLPLRKNKISNFPIFSLNKIKNFILIFFSLLFILAWNSPHCCKNRIGFGAIDVVVNLFKKIN